MEDITKILSLVQLQTNIDFSTYRLSMLKRRIKNRCIINNCESNYEYLKFINDNTFEISKLASSLTINVSEFFRDPMTFDYIDQYVLPQIINSNNNILRIWSAGCANGEEAYSLAILIKEKLIKNNIKKTILFFASDINNESLEYARTGLFDKTKLDNVKLKHIEKYFIKKGNAYLINNDIKELVKFSQHDILSERNQVPPESIYGNFDLILCRNLLIYFTPKYQEKILNRLFNTLSINGYLVLGASENLSENLKQKFTTFSSLFKIFQNQVSDINIFSDISQIHYNR